MAEPPAAARPGAPAAAYTLRVTFVWRGDAIALAGSRRVRMTAPASTASLPAGERSGYWFELRDATGALLWHRTLHDPIRADVEVFAHDRKESIARVQSAAPQGEFELLVPDLPDAQTFTLFGPPAEGRLEGARAQPLARIPVDDLRRASRNPGGDPTTPGEGRR